MRQQISCGSPAPGVVLSPEKMDAIIQSQGSDSMFQRCPLIAHSNDGDMNPGIADLIDGREKMAMALKFREAAHRDDQTSVANYPEGRAHLMNRAAIRLDPSPHSRAVNPRQNYRLSRKSNRRLRASNVIADRNAHISASVKDSSER